MKYSLPIHWQLVLTPFSWLYGLVIWIRNKLFDLGILPSESFHMPIISVGNITVGGTGKTPHVEYLVRMLKDEFRVAVLSRGYRRRTTDFRMASPASGTLDVGDEAMQIKLRYPDVTVAVDRKRVNGTRELMKLAPPLEVLVLDDAFQHRAIKAGFSILLCDYNRPILKDKLLPAGSLREPARNRDRAHMILVTKSPAELKPIEMREFVKGMEPMMGQHLFFTSMELGGLVPVFQEGQGRGEDWFRENACGIIVISGVVNPDSLIEYGGNINKNVRQIRFPDHHRYSNRDIQRISNEMDRMGDCGGEILLLTTEKDAAKFREMAFPERMRSVLHAARLKVKFLNNDEEIFKNLIHTYVTSNKRGSILHQEPDRTES